MSISALAYKLLLFPEGNSTAQKGIDTDSNSIGVGGGVCGMVLVHNSFSLLHTVLYPSPGVSLKVHKDKEKTLCKYC